MIVFRQLHARAHRRRRCALASSAGFALRGRAQRAEGAVAGESDTMRMMAALPCCSRNVVGELTALQTNSVEIGKYESDRSPCVGVSEDEELSCAGRASRSDQRVKFLFRLTEREQSR